MGPGHQPKESGPRGTPPTGGSAAFYDKRIVKLRFDANIGGMSKKLDRLIAKLKIVTREAVRAEKAIAKLSKGRKL